jgi:hypothetical protein
MTGRLLSIAVLIASGRFAFADTVPVCSGETLADFIGFGSTGCMAGEFTVKNFSWRDVRASDGYTVLGPGDVSASVINSEGSPIVQISGNFIATGNEFVSYKFAYLIDPPPVIIRGFEEEMETFTPRDGGITQIRTLVCAGGFIEECDDLFQLSVFHDGQNPKTFDSVVFPRLVNVVDVQHLIKLDANGGLADFSGFTTRAQVVPEPSSFIAAAAGLAMILLRRRRS